VKPDDENVAGAPVEPEPDEPTPWSELDRRVKLAQIGLAALAAGLGIALAVIVAEPPTEKVFVTRNSTTTTTSTAVPTTTVTTITRPTTTTSTETTETVTETTTQVETSTVTETSTVETPPGVRAAPDRNPRVEPGA